MRTRMLVVAAVAAALAVSLAGCSTSGSSSSSSANGSTITLATDANYPPCESYTAGTKNMVGFEPDLWNAIAKKTGETLKVTNTDFDSLIPGVQDGRYDIAMECISDNPTREKQVSFLDFVYAADAVITTSKYDGPINNTDPLSVCGESMGAQSGFDVITTVTSSINPACEKAGKKPVSVSTFPSAAASYNALYSGRVDFIIQDTAAAGLLDKSAPVKLVLHQNSMLPKLYLGIVFKKSESAELAKWNKALKEVIADGTYDKVLKKWSIDDLALTPGKNLATKNPIPTS